MVIEDNAISCDFVRSASECESAANELGLADVTVIDDGQNGVSFDPPFCYFEGGSLKYNNEGTNTGSCTTNDHCVCRQKDFCAKTPCAMGQGDCDDDSECEGSLVCGHMNCVNNTITDCCTQPCMLQDYYTLIIGGNDGSTTLDTVEVVSQDSTSNCKPNCMKNLSNIPTPIKGAVGTTFGKLMKVIKATVFKSR